VEGGPVWLLGLPCCSSRWLLGWILGGLGTRFCGFRLLGLGCLVCHVVPVDGFWDGYILRGLEFLAFMEFHCFINTGQPEDPPVGFGLSGQGAHC